MSTGIPAMRSYLGLRMQLAHRLQVERPTIALDLGGDAPRSAHAILASRAGGACAAALRGRGVAGWRGGGRAER